MAAHLSRQKILDLSRKWSSYSHVNFTSEALVRCALENHLPHGTIQSFKTEESSMDVVLRMHPQSS